jgi:hypothetical protein
MLFSLLIKAFVILQADPVGISKFQNRCHTDLIGGSLNAPLYAVYGVLQFTSAQCCTSVENSFCFGQPPKPKLPKVRTHGCGVGALWRVSGTSPLSAKCRPKSPKYPGWRSAIATPTPTATSATKSPPAMLRRGGRGVVGGELVIPNPYRYLPSTACLHAFLVQTYCRGFCFQITIL